MFSPWARTLFASISCTSVSQLLALAVEYALKTAEKPASLGPDDILSDAIPLFLSHAHGFCVLFIYFFFLAWRLFCLGSKRTSRSACHAHGRYFHEHDQIAI